jgi:hypothetical protein
LLSDCFALELWFDFLRISHFSPPLALSLQESVRYFRESHDRFHSDPKLKLIQRNEVQMQKLRDVCSEAYWTPPEGIKDLAILNCIKRSMSTADVFA